MDGIRELNSAVDHQIGIMDPDKHQVHPDFANTSQGDNMNGEILLLSILNHFGRRYLSRIGSMKRANICSHCILGSAFGYLCGINRQNLSLSVVWVVAAIAKEV